MMADEMILHNIGKLITFPGEGPVPGGSMNEPLIIEDAAVTIGEGKITGVGPGKDIWDQADLSKDAECIDCNGKCVVPGFVDPHTHLVFGGSREFELGMKLGGASYLDILNAGGGILRTMKDTRALTVEQLVEQMDRRMNKMMIYGTTTVEIKSGYGLDVDTELRLLEAIGASNHPMDRVATFLGPHAIPPEYRYDPDGFLDLMISMLPQISRSGLAEYADIFCERNVFDLEQSRRFLTAAKEAGLKLKIHSDEIANLGGTSMGAELGAVSADHLLVSNDKDLEAMRKNGTIPVLLPGTLMTIFEDRIPRAIEMMEMGLPVALATDLNPNCMVESLQLIQALACYRLRMTPNQVLAATTANSAAAIGMGDRKGRIKEGYDADILILKEGSFDHVVYNFGVNHVDTVIKGGNVINRDIGW